MLILCLPGPEAQVPREATDSGSREKAMDIEYKTFTNPLT